MKNSTLWRLVLFPKNLFRLWRSIALYFEKYGMLRGAYRVFHKAASPVFRPTLFKLLRPKGGTLGNAGEGTNPVKVVLPDLLPLQPVDELIVDNTIGGGANDFCLQYVRSLDDAGKTWRLLRFNLLSRHYEVYDSTAEHTWAVRENERGALLRALQESQPRAVMLNNIVSWPDPLGCLAWLTGMAKNVPLTFFVHDFFCLCPTIILLDNSLSFCGLPEDKAICKACLWKNVMAAPYTPADIVRWRSAWLCLLEAAARIHILHASVGEMLVKVYPDLQPKLNLLVPSPLAQLRPLQRCAHQADLPTVIGVIGKIGVHKGALIIKDLLRLLDASRCGSRIVVVGELELNVSSPCLTVTGPYQREHLPELLEWHQVTICLMPSVWPETYSYVMDELMALDVPVVCFDIGAQGAKARAYTQGAVAAAITAESCLEAIDLLESFRRAGGTQEQA